MKKIACFALFAALTVGPRIAEGQVTDTVPPTRQQRMQVHSPRMADRMGVYQRRADRRQMNHPRMQRGGQSGMQRGMRGRGLGMGGGFSPSALLGQQQSLGLAPEQVTQLEAIRDQVDVADEQANTDLTARRQELADAWGAGQVDPDQIRTRTQAVLDAEQAVTLAHAQAMAQAQALLTDEQRGRVRGRADAMRMGGWNQRGMTRGNGRGMRSQPSRGMRSSRGRYWRPI